MKILIACFALIIVSACSFKEPYKKQYTLDVQTEAPTQRGMMCQDKSLKVSQAFSSNRLMDRQMSYIEGAYREYAFSESEWAQSPNSIITQKLISSIRQSGLFKSVEGYKSRSKSDYLLESTIEEFVQYYSEDAKHSYVKAVMHFVLIDAKSSEVISSKSLSKKIELQSLKADEGVSALSKALSEIFKEKNIWLSEECR